MTRWCSCILIVRVLAMGRPRYDHHRDGSVGFHPNWVCPVLMSCSQTEDDLAEKLRSNEMLQKAINTYKEAAELPNATADLLRAALRRRAERQQFLGTTTTKPCPLNMDNMDYLTSTDTGSF